MRPVCDPDTVIIIGMMPITKSCYGGVSLKRFETILFTILSRYGQISILVRDGNMKGNM